MLLTGLYNISLKYLRYIHLDLILFQIIRCLLIVPFPESALNEEAGKMFMEDYEEYAKHARLITELYALPKEKLSQPLPLSSPLVSSLSFSKTLFD